MKKRTSLFVVIIIIVALFIVSISGYISHRLKQEHLARELGVRIHDYPGEDIFPVGYFEKVLEPGLTVDQVHNMVKGYTNVFHCSKDIELYYYFSADDDKATRFAILYTNDGKLHEVISQDPNSHTLNSVVCDPGLIEE